MASQAYLGLYAASGRSFASRKKKRKKKKELAFKCHLSLTPAFPLPPPPSFLRRPQPIAPAHAPHCTGISGRPAAAGQPR